MWQRLRGLLRQRLPSVLRQSLPRWIGERSGGPSASSSEALLHFDACHTIVSWRGGSAITPTRQRRDLSKTRPNTFTLLGEPVVVWFANGAWNVLRDCCPHRLVPLSEGRIDEHGQMECGYHGEWCW